MQRDGMTDREGTPVRDVEVINAGQCTEIGRENNLVRRAAARAQRQVQPIAFHHTKHGAYARVNLLSGRHEKTEPYRKRPSWCVPSTDR